MLSTPKDMNESLSSTCSPAANHIALPDATDPVTVFGVHFASRRMAEVLDAMKIVPHPCGVIALGNDYVGVSQTLAGLSSPRTQNNTHHK